MALHELPTYEGNSGEPRQKVRLGGMALRNGLLIHGPTSWAVAARTPEGDIGVASGRKPVFSRGRFAQDSSVRTQVTDFRCAIEIGGVWIEPGDLVFGDLDGVVVVPKKVQGEVIEKSLEKARKENVVRKAIEAGMSSTAALKKYKVL